MIRGGFWIKVTCDQCGRVQEFTKKDKDEAIQAAKDEGWVIEFRRDKAKTQSVMCKYCYTPIYTMGDLRAARTARRARGKVTKGDI